MVIRLKRCRSTPSYQRTSCTRSSSYDYETFIYNINPTVPIHAFVYRSDVEGVVEEELLEVVEVDESIMLV